ncbi:MbnP family protein [Algoriphagus sp. NG3]|uniref:MbnP family protein n=1 Tax=Algoriphagus sp. NG3 TaxID=3097546 RepID=UPI002A83ED8F|nr:MbnP family protein [Algoriphagus sp. NG3]WPR75865.1 MbnP family protein [Algoriphagus sp. NG3]
MNKIYSPVLFLCVSAILILSSCIKEEPGIDLTKTGEFSIEFDSIVGEETFGLEPRQYTNAKGEVFSIRTLQYFISNIKLYTESGDEYVVPQEDSYFLVQAHDRNSRFTKVTVPEGDYNKISFVLGVDSLRNTKPVEERPGVLSFDPGQGHGGGGMYWGWNSGYIFFKFEGTCDLISDDQQGDPTGNKQFKYHIGGFGGYSAPTINNIKEISMNLNQGGIAQVREGLRSNVHLFVDVMNVFNGQHTFSIPQHPNVMFSDFSVNIANNFPGMFSHDHTENFTRGEDEL